MVSKFHNITRYPKGQVNKVYTIVKGRETFNGRHAVTLTGCREVNYVLLEAKSVYVFWARLSSFDQLGFISDLLWFQSSTKESMIPKDKKLKFIL